jgi:hypothetical protein
MYCGHLHDDVITVVSKCYYSSSAATANDFIVLSRLSWPTARALLRNTRRVVRPEKKSSGVARTLLSGRADDDATKYQLSSASARFNLAAVACFTGCPCAHY